MKQIYGLGAFSIFVTAIFAVFSGPPVSAQGVIIPIICDIRPCRPPIPRPVPLPNALPVKSIKLDTQISGQVATTRVEQIFRNDTPYTLEGTYFFPIPETASIVEFSIWENGKKLSGEVRTREEARRIYDEIVRRQRDPGLLEYAGKDLFQASIFPIPPNSDKKLELAYSEVLNADSGTVAYRYPLGTGRNLWRSPHPGVETRGTDVRTQKFGTVSGRIEISGKGALRNIYSPSHKVDVQAKGERTATVSFETTGNDNDFQLFYGVSNDDFGMSLLTYREPGKPGYFLLMLSPRDNISEREVVNKDIVFVLDTSGSMAEEGKLEKARAALLFGIRTLREGDRFNIISFSGEEHLMENRLVEADSTGKRTGEDFVAKMTASGGTNINDALIASLKQFEKNDRPKMLVFMTDGLPTVGETNVEKITSNVKSANNIDVRVFPFGFGYDVNTKLLDKIGTENSGMSDYIQPKEDLEVKVSNFFARVSSPVLADVQIDFGPLRVENMYPRKFGDLFKGMQLAVLGRYTNSADLKGIDLLLRGKTGTDARSFHYRNLDFPLHETENDFLPRLWASRRVGWLIEEIRTNGETKELKDEIIDLGTRFGIVTPYTSYLATDGSYATVPQGVVTLDRENRAVLAMRPGVGKDSVEMSTKQRAAQENLSATVDITSDDEQILVRDTNESIFIGTKTFFLKDGVWVDAEAETKRNLIKVNIKFGSDEFFHLLSREKELARYLSIGSQVVIVWKGSLITITN